MMAVSCFFLLLLAAFLLLAILCVVNPRWAFQSARGKGVAIYSAGAFLSLVLVFVAAYFAQGDSVETGQEGGDAQVALNPAGVPSQSAKIQESTYAGAEEGGEALTGPTAEDEGASTSDLQPVEGMGTDTAAPLEEPGESLQEQATREVDSIEAGRARELQPLSAAFIYLVFQQGDLKTLIGQKFRGDPSFEVTSIVGEFVIYRSSVEIGGKNFQVAVEREPNAYYIEGQYMSPDDGYVFTGAQEFRTLIGSGTMIPTLRRKGKAI